MRILESAPSRYDAGMRLLTLGGWDRSHRLIAERAVRGAGTRVLDVGCGTGALAARLLALGARVIGIDQDPQMLDRARERLAGTLPDRWALEERTAAELDRFEPGSFDAVTLSLVLSEMSPVEREFVLRAGARLLAPGGVLVCADEVRPRGRLARGLHRVARVPLALLAWLVTGGVTRPVPDLAAEVSAAGLRVTEERRSRLGSFSLVSAERPE
jgi:demethylmenaquinone methyltransferase/2-methoxy-6-polyprenyl-1,4-benzoquinol methylase